MRSYPGWASLVQIVDGVASLRAFQQGVSSSEMDALAACGTSTLTGAAEAAREAAEMAAHGLGGAAVDLVLVFVSPQHVGQAQAVAEVVHDRLAPRVLAGACGESVIGR